MVLDMTFVVNDPAFVEPLSVDRATVGGYDPDGNYVPPATTVINFQGSSEPASGEDLLVLPEGERNKNVRAFFTSQQLQTTDNNIPADIITDHLGKDWKVIFIGDWSVHGCYHALAEAIPVGSANNPVNPPDALVAGQIWDFTFDQDLVLDANDNPVAATGDDAYGILSDTVARQCATIQGFGLTLPQWFSDPRIAFNGDYWYTFGIDSGMSPLLLDFTAFFVLRPDITTGEVILCNGNAFIGFSGITIRLSTEAGIYRKSGTTVSATSGGVMDIAAPNIVVTQVDSSGSVLIRLVNAAGDNSNTASGTISTLATSNSYDFGSCDGLEVYQGDVYRSFMYDQVLDSAEIDQNVNYLKGVFGI